jgi:hypothetical protein
MELSGYISILSLYDVCEGIRLKDLPVLQGQAVAPSFKDTAPESPRFERPPVVEAIQPAVIRSGEEFEAALHYYDYGVVSLVLRFKFTGDLQKLRDLAARWVSSTAFDELSLRLIREKVAAVHNTLDRPYAQWLTEDYYIFQVAPAQGLATAGEALSQHSQEIAQIVRGEAGTLSEGERAEVLQASMSYYPTDLAVIGWGAAFLLDTEQGAEATIRLLEYANSQLLQFRHYDELLTRELHDVYRKLQRGAGVLSGWSMRPAAARLRTILLDVRELTERTTTALKFVGDMFTARLYKLGLTRIGVNDYQALVEEKLSTAENLYSVMIEQFQHSRGFVLEVLVVIILIIELAFLFRGSK